MGLIQPALGPVPGRAFSSRNLSMKHILRLIALLALVPAALHAQAQPSFTVGGYSFLGNGNFSVGVTSGGVLVPIQVLADGTVVTSGGGGGGGGTSSNFGSTFPTAGTAAGFKDSTGLLMSFAKVNASNALTVDGSGVTQPINQTQMNGVALAAGNGTTNTGTQRVTLSSDSTGQVAIAGSVAVTGTFYQATQPVSGTFWQTTQPVSLTTLPALVAGTANIGHVDGQGTAGTPSGGVVSVQGVTSGTVLPTQESRLPASFGQQAAANGVSTALANEDVQDLYFTGQSAQTATVNNIIPATSGTAATDATGYQSGSIEVDSTGTAGTYILEGSNSNVNFVTVPMFNITVYTGTPITGAVTASSANILYVFPVQYRYIRLRIASTITGGSIQAFTALKRTAFSGAATLVANSTTANLLTNSNVVSINGTPVVTGGVAGIQAIGGNIADGSAQTANPVEVAGYTVTTVPAAALGNSITKRVPISGDYQVIVHQDGDPSNEFQSTSGTTALATTSSTQLQAAGGSGIRHYVTGIQVVNNSTTGGTCSILDGSTVIWTGYLPATGASLQEVPVSVEFRTPLKGTAATALNIQLGSASMSVYYNVQGFNAN